MVSVDIKQNWTRRNYYLGERGRDRIWGHTAFSRTEVSVKPFTLVRKLSGLFTNWSLRLKQSPFLSATCTNFTFLEVTALYSPFLCLLLLTLHLHCPSPPLSFTSPVLHLPWPSPPLAFTCPVLHLPCTSHALSFTCPVLHFPCPSYALSFTSPVLHMPCPSPPLSFTCPVLHLTCPSHALSFTSLSFTSTVLHLPLNPFRQPGVGGSAATECGFHGPVQWRYSPGCGTRGVHLWQCPPQQWQCLRHVHWNLHSPSVRSLPVLSAALHKWRRTGASFRRHQGGYRDFCLRLNSYRVLQSKFYSDVM